MAAAKIFGYVLLKFMFKFAYAHQPQNSNVSYFATHSEKRVICVSLAQQAWALCATSACRQARSWPLIAQPLPPCIQSRLFLCRAT